MPKKKSYLSVTLVVVFIVSFFANTTHAGLGILPQFGGRIISTTAPEIAELEMAGYECFVPGSTISIRPIGSPIGTPTSYFIPSGTYSKTGYNPRAGQLIIGKYRWLRGINCHLSYYPYTPTIIWLQTVSLFGNSAI